MQILKVTVRKYLCHQVYCIFDTAIHWFVNNAAILGSGVMTANFFD